MLTSDLNGFLYAKSYSEISVLIPFHTLLDIGVQSFYSKYATKCAP